jgi:hypothetical protein
MSDDTFQRPTLEIYGDFAARTQREISTFEHQYPSVAQGRVLQHLRWTGISVDKDQKAFFVAYSNPKSLDKYSLYCGVFAPIAVSSDSRMLIRSRSFLDGIFPFKQAESYKTGVRTFDSKAVIKMTKDEAMIKLINSRETQAGILEALERYPNFFFTVNTFPIDFIPALKGRSHCGFFSLEKWFVTDEEIEGIMNLIKHPGIPSL